MKKYNKQVMQAIRQNLGLHETDRSFDKYIMSMSTDEAFSRYCIWVGLQNVDINIMQMF